MHLKLLDVLGLPILLFICDQLIMSKPFACSQSVCEFIANRLCCCICTNRKRQKKTKAAEKRETNQGSNEKNPQVQTNEEDPEVNILR